MKQKETICWQCDKACGKCAWSKKNPQPISGWKAKPTMVRITNNRYIQSYIVTSCPLFAPEQR